MRYTQRHEHDGDIGVGHVVDEHQAVLLWRVTERVTAYLHSVTVRVRPGDDERDDPLEEQALCSPEEREGTEQEHPAQVADRAHHTEDREQQHTQVE